MLKIERWVPHAMLCGIVLFMGALGCSHRPTKLAGEIADADRILATNIGSHAGFSVAGDEVRRIAQAVASAKRDRNTYAASFGWHMDFYSGTNFLASIVFQDRLFRIGNGQYRDDTGVLKEFHDRYVTDASARALSQ
jgi:hypothetical protein